MTVTIHHGDAWELAEDLALFAPQSINCIVTSPPYWGLRDYGEPGQFGLEPTPEAYVAKLVELFALLRPALRDDGTVWLNLGDSYASFRDSKCVPQSLDGEQRSMPTGGASNRGAGAFTGSGIKHKDLCGIPWRVAFALQADGWYLRQDIIWHKPNPMPESVTDRCTKAHEYIFLLSKSPRYYYDNEAIKEPCATQDTNVRDRESTKLNNVPGRTHMGGLTTNDYATRNKRDVWTVATKPFAAAHFATFPPALIKPCVLAGCPERVCPKCGAPWKRIVERTPMEVTLSDRTGEKKDAGLITQCGGTMTVAPTSKTVGYEPTCSCGRTDSVPGTVLDPFGGSGTTAMVARDNGRNAILFELNAEYIEIAKTHRLKEVKSA